MRLGFDLDGVLFDFNQGFCRLAREEFNYTHIPVPDSQWPTQWDYLVADGYLSRQQYSQLWNKIATESFGFWYDLPEYPWTTDLLAASLKVDEVYFITSRCGPRRHYESTFAVERALRALLPEELQDAAIAPTVIPVDDHSKKLPIIKALGLTHYIDDRRDSMELFSRNHLDKSTKLALWDMPWNRTGGDILGVQRLKSVADFKEWLQ